jgi:hypothetical protein
MRASHVHLKTTWIFGEREIYLMWMADGFASFVIAIIMWTPRPSACPFFQCPLSKMEGED